MLLRRSEAGCYPAMHSSSAAPPAPLERAANFCSLAGSPCSITALARTPCMQPVWLTPARAAAAAHAPRHPNRSAAQPASRLCSRPAEHSCTPALPTHRAADFTSREFRSTRRGVGVATAHTLSAALEHHLVLISLWYLPGHPAVPLRPAAAWCMPPAALPLDHSHRAALTHVAAASCSRLAAYLGATQGTTCVASGAGPCRAGATRALERERSRETVTGHIHVPTYIRFMVTGRTAGPR